MNLTLNGGRIYKGSDAEIELPVWMLGFEYEEYPDATAYFYTKDSDNVIVKPVSGLPTTDEMVLFHFSAVELDTIGNGVLWYKIDYGSVVREWNTMWYIVTPEGYSPTGGYATEEYVNEAIDAAISGISAVTVDEVEGMIAEATSGLTKKTSFTAHTADTSIHFTMSDVETDISGYLRRNSYAQMSDVNDAVGAAVSQIEYELGSYVRSDTCHEIWTGTQAQYDAMSAHTADTLYIIQD